MVRSTFAVLSVCLAFIMSVSAEPSNPLQARQGFSLPQGSVPDSCKDVCNGVVNSLTGCADITCVCSDKVASGLQSCMDCASSKLTDSDKSQVQTALNQYSDSCKSAGHPVKAVTLGSSSSSKNGAIGLRSGMVMSAGALVSVAGMLYVL